MRQRASSNSLLLSKGPLRFLRQVAKADVDSNGLIISTCRFPKLSD
jgi:hypothetical protein